MKYRVVVKPESGEALSNQIYESEQEADQYIAELRSSVADEVFART